jgi:parallel beta-helix repeat protein
MRGAYLGLRYPAKLISTSMLVCLTIALVMVLRADFAYATHVNCGDTVTTDTVLDSDLIDCPNNGIIIGADGITLDLNGHSVDGDGQPFEACPEGEFCDVGVLNDGHRGVRVLNGLVSEFAEGVFILGAHHNRVSGVTSYRNASFGFIVFASARSVIRNSAGSENIPPEGDGLGLFGSHRIRIVGNSFTRNGLGIHVQDSTNNLIKGNLIAGTRDGPGILVEADHNEMRGNDCRRNGICILVAKGDGNVVARNRVRAGDDGIAVENGRRNLVIRNLVLETRDTGIYLGLALPPIGGRSNVVRDNVVIGSGSDAFKVTKNDHHSVLRQNVAREAGDDGFKVRSSTAKLSDNRAVSNGDLGIQAAPGVIDGGGNRARGNGDPRQCVNIACN